MIVGMGRVILDHPAGEELATSATKKKAARKKRGVKEEVPAKVPIPVADSGAPRGPNWPDSQFPWSLRSDEYSEESKRKEEERLHWIKRFLDRESDEEEESEIMPSANWGEVYEDPPMPFRTGRGKMVPLSTHSSDRGPPVKRSAYFPSDPADARAALLSKKAVRTLPDRKQHIAPAYNGESDESDEVLCTCGGTDDGRELVQCDGCQNWYHWQCIGVESLTDLGSEEDPWYCPACVSRTGAPRTPSPDIRPIEPTFVPTEEKRAPEKRSDHPFLPSLRDSPVTPFPARLPRTPKGGHFDNDFSTTTPWNESSKFAPHTPSFTSSGSRFDILESEDPSYESLSSPTRLPFTTPKSIWHKNLFQTPTRSSLGSPSKLFPYEGYATAPYETPIRRSAKPAANAPRLTQTPDSPLTAPSTSQFQSSPASGLSKFENVPGPLDGP